MKYSNYNDIDLHETIMMYLTAYGLVDEIEYLNHHEPELLTEWCHRIINHYNLHTYICDNVLMQYLYHDWTEATENWYKYGELVGDMLQLYIDELTDKLQDSWERKYSC